MQQHYQKCHKISHFCSSRNSWSPLSSLSKSPSASFSLPSCSRCSSLSVGLLGPGPAQNHCPWPSNGLARGLHGLHTSLHFIQIGPHLPRGKADGFLHWFNLVRYLERTRNREGDSQQPRFRRQAGEGICL